MAIQIDLLIKLLKPTNCIQETTRSWVLPKVAAVHYPKLFLSNLVYWLNSKVCCLGKKFTMNAGFKEKLSAFVVH